MAKTTLTIHIEHDLLDRAQRYAGDHNTNLTRLINEYLRRLTTEPDFLKNAPITQRLSGSLLPEVSVEDYQQYLLKKMAGKIKVVPYPRCNRPNC